ncbi:MAG: hypothetical protein M3277_09775 [Actinomycetota bacterium]|nr:hypothetical protein [Actinomycetota bacterium]
MTLSVRTKIVMSLVALLGLVAYLIVVDLGVSAGRIHHGVRIADNAGLDLGGLTREEATALLEERELELARAPVFFTREGFECEFLPTELVWDARPFETAVAAFRIGRGESPLRALGARVRAWVGGVKVDWADDLDSSAVTRFIDDCEVQATAFGYDLRRYRLRKKIARAVTTWPRRPFNIPIRG